MAAGGVPVVWRGVRWVARVDGEASRGDLAAAAGRPPGADAEAPLVLRAGDDVDAVLDTGAPRPGEPGPLLRVRVVGGPWAQGRERALGLGRHVVGRGPGSAVALDDPTTAARHAVLVVEAPGRVHVQDLGSVNGTLVAAGAGAVPLPAGGSALLALPAQLHIGATVLALSVPPERAAPVSSPPPGPDGTAPFHRAPQPAPPPLPPALRVPPAPAPPSPSPSLGVVAVAGPLVTAAVLVVALGNPVYALLSALAPVLAVGAHLEGRRRARHGSRRAAAARRGAVDAFAAAVREAARAALARRAWAAPPVAEVVARALAAAPSMWSRRPGAPGFLAVRVGTAACAWRPELEREGEAAADDVAAVLAAEGRLAAGPAVVDLGHPGALLGIAGPRAVALSVARAVLLQAAVHQGPADVAVVLAGPAPEWAWASWLPHAAGQAGGAGLDERAAARSAAAARGGPRPFVVLDGTGEPSPALRATCAVGSGLAVAPTVEQLPAGCTALLAVDERGHGRLVDVGSGRADEVLADGTGVDVTERVARALARWHDPEAALGDGALPVATRLLPLLGLDPPTPAGVVARWAEAARTGRLAVPLGAGVDGPVRLDLDTDGPHALVGGTTGAGKSELLRTLVAALAASAAPEDCTFVLVDFKGGSAFDACASLPHVVGLVTDLDEGLADRARRSLEAELRQREALLRTIGAPDLAAYRRAGSPGGPLPRLVVVVDEFASLRAEHPEVVDSLLGIAQRGRSLGVHLVLATQRPAGAISDAIRANTDLRIALRVLDDADSTDVVEVPDAASLPRDRPGRALVRFAGRPPQPVQTALVTGPAPPSCRSPVVLLPVAGEPAAVAGATDLDALVDACTRAWLARGAPAPRRPWVDPLPARLDLDEAGDAVGLVDDPSHQRRLPLAWGPADGNLVVVGAVGSGVTTTLLAVARHLAASRPPSALHLYAVDMGGGDLSVLERLAHTGAVVRAGDTERQLRLVLRLRDEVARRRACGREPGSGAPDVVLVVDGLAALRDAHGGAGPGLPDDLARLVTEGPEVGVHTVLAAERPAAVPSALLATAACRWVHRLADPLDGAAAGVGGRLPPLPPGRVVDAASGLRAHVAVPSGGWAEALDAVAARWPASGGPEPVRTLPATVRWRDLARPGCRRRTEASTDERALWLGLDVDTLEPAALRLWPGEHALVAGPPRSGRTSALAVLVESAQRSPHPPAVVVALAGARSWLRELGGLELAADAAGLAGALAAPNAGWVLGVVDDAEAVDDPSGALESLLADPARAGVVVVAAGRADALRAGYGHWTRTVRRSRTGVLLLPQPELDGDLLGTVVPRRTLVPPAPGRGVLVLSGAARAVQLVAPGGSRG